MPIADQIRSLTEDIETSYGARTMAIANLVKSTHKTLVDYRETHRKAADDLRELLISDCTERASKAQNMKAANVKARIKSAQELKEKAKNLTEFLSSSEKERIKDFDNLMEEIKGMTAGIEKDTIRTLSHFRSSHREMASDLKTTLSHETKTRINKVKDLLSDFIQERKERTNSLKRRLASFQKNLSEEVNELRTNISDDLQQAQTHWQNLAKVMAAKRVGKPIPSVKTKSGISPAAEEEAEKAFETGEITEKISEVVYSHPNGITLPEIGKVLKIPNARVAKTIKDLLLKMKISKRDSEYFPGILSRLKEA